MNYTDRDVIDAVRTSTSKRQCIMKLGLIPAGGNYDTINRYIKRLNLDIGHFKGKGWNKGKKFPPKRNIEEYLNNNYSIKSNRLKKRLIKENIKEFKCEHCKRVEWFDRPIALELHHVDGNKYNNSLNNLRILCPNCHSQTSNWRKSK